MAMIKAIGAVRQHGGSLALTLPASMCVSLSLRAGDEVIFYVEKATEERKDEEKARSNYPAIGQGELNIDYQNKVYRIAQFEKIYFSKEHYRAGYGNETNWETKTFFAGVLFKGQFDVKAIAELKKNYKLSQSNVPKLIEHYGILTIKMPNGSMQEVRELTITSEEMHAENNEIYNIHFHGR